MDAFSGGCAFFVCPIAQSGGTDIRSFERRPHNPEYRGKILAGQKTKIF
jgi:hypothetical protein